MNRLSRKSHPELGFQLPPILVILTFITSTLCLFINFGTLVPKSYWTAPLGHPTGMSNQST